MAVTREQAQKEFKRFFTNRDFTEGDFRNAQRFGLGVFGQSAQKITGRSLEGTLVKPERTLPEEVPPIGQRELPEATGSLSNFKDVLRQTALAARAQRPSIQEELGEFEEAGVELTTPTAIGEAVRQGIVGRREVEESRFASIIDLIEEQESARNNARELSAKIFGTVLQQNPAVLSELTKDEFFQIQQGEIPLSVIQRVGKLAEESELSISEQIALREKGLKLEGGRVIKDLSRSSTNQIAQAIKQIESGGNYNATGASGEFGAYQFMPDTWRQWSQEYTQSVGIQQSISPTPENQDAVARFKIKQWQDQGFTPDQIASLWNSGSPDPTGKVGINSKGVSFNVPAYVERFKNVLGQSITTSVSPLAQQVVENPALISTVTLSQATEIRKELAENGIQIPQVLDLERKIKFEQDLRKEFNKTAKDTKESIRQIKIMNVSFEGAKKDKTKMNAASQGVLVVFQKMLDPTSVVRESEYARSGTGLSLEGRIEGAIEKLKKGGAGVPLKDLRDFVDLANTYFEQIYKPAIIDEAIITKQTADTYGLDVSLILTPEILSLIQEKPQLSDQNGNIFEYESTDDPDYIRDFNSGFITIK